MEAKQLDTFYNAYLSYLSASVHALITNRQSKKLQQGKLEFEQAANDLIDLKRYDENDMLVASLMQLTLSVHQVTRTGFCSEVRGMIHHPLEDMLGNIVQFINSFDVSASNDPMMCILEDQIDALSEIHHECVTEAPQDAGNVALLLCHLKDMSLCLHCLSHLQE